MLAPTPTLLEEAKAEVERLRRRLSQTRPGELADACLAAAKDAENNVVKLSAELLRLGLLPEVDSTRLHEDLQRHFRHARNRQVVTFRGSRFRKRITRKDVAGAEPAFQVSWEAV